MTLTKEQHEKEMALIEAWKASRPDEAIPIRRRAQEELMGDLLASGKCIVRKCQTCGSESLEFTASQKRT